MYFELDLLRLLKTVFYIGKGENLKMYRYQQVCGKFSTNSKIDLKIIQIITNSNSSLFCFYIIILSYSYIQISTYLFLIFTFQQEIEMVRTNRGNLVEKRSEVPLEEGVLSLVI
ncbi:hypothetical protein C0J52_23615 [Blattella germanica]|nr:hypothetical protein C0J52_23615 [Blattella germanica]